MIRISTVVFYILLHTFTAPAQSSVWKIEGNETCIYLGGSIHLLREKDYPLPGEFEIAFGQSDKLVLETNIDPDNLEELRSKILRMTGYPGHQSLKTELRKEVYEKLDSALKESGMTLESMNSLKPVMAILTLTYLELNKMGVTSEGVDIYFMNKAKKEGKEIIFLESIEEQIGLLSQMGDGIENDYVLRSLKELEFYREEFEQSISHWKEGNVFQWEKQVNGFNQTYPELYRSLLAERNNNWVPHLENYLKTPETEFIVVGVMHLYGPDGILNLMEENGYRIEQLK